MAPLERAARLGVRPRWPLRRNLDRTFTERRIAFRRSNAANAFIVKGLIWIVDPDSERRP
jgi:hypothetical protein